MKLIPKSRTFILGSMVVCSLILSLILSVNSFQYNLFFLFFHGRGGMFIFVQGNGMGCKNCPHPILKKAVSFTNQMNSRHVLRDT